MLGKRLSFWKFVECFQRMTTKHGGEDGSGTQKHEPVSSPDTIGAEKETSTSSTSDRNTKTKSTNLYLDQGKTVDVLHNYVIL